MSCGGSSSLAHRFYACENKESNPAMADFKQRKLMNFYFFQKYFRLVVKTTFKEDFLNSQNSRNTTFFPCPSLIRAGKLRINSLQKTGLIKLRNIFTHSLVSLLCSSMKKRTPNLTYCNYIQIISASCFLQLMQS